MTLPPGAAGFSMSAARTEAATETPRAGRLYHLDALRSFAILYGLLVHTATLGVSWPLTLISDVSGYFRMGTFFLVSGFFAALVLSRLQPKLFLERRAVALLVPLFCGIVLLNPVTNWLIWCWHNPPLGLIDYLSRVAQGTLPAGRGPMVWHLHLWFLVSLGFYAAMAPVVVALSRRLPRALRSLPDAFAALPGWLCVAVVATGVAVTALMLRIGYEVVLEPVVPTAAAWLVRTSLYYWPLFLTGMLAFHHAAFLNRFQTVSLPALILGIAGVVLLRQTLPASGTLWEVLQILTRAFLTTAAIAALLAVFRRWFSAPGFLSRQADAVYSIYILHFVLIYLIAHGLRLLDLPPMALFFAVAALTFLAAMALHRFGIRPVPLFSLMFNGKPMGQVHPGQAGREKTLRR